MSKLLLVITLSLVILVCYSWWFSVNHPQHPPILVETDFNQDLYDFGEMHYTSMDIGMSSCWNNTVKKLLQLSCPRIAKGEPDLEIELAYLLTSCFCLTIGKPRLTCRPPSRRQTEELYHFSLIECGMKKCFNRYNFDAFEINYSRVPDLCYYYLYEVAKNKMDPFIEHSDLERLKGIVSGEDVTEFDNTLEILDDIVKEELTKRRQSDSDLILWLKRQVERLGLTVDDFLFKFCIGKYADVPYY